mgnify:CR=1 FL=1
MIELILIILILWIGGLTVAVIILDRCLKNQEKLLYLLRNEINSKTGHIYIKTKDKDFNCKGITLNDIGEKK